MTLLAHVRSLTGVDSTLVPDTVVEDALRRHRVWNDADVCWLDERNGTAPVWGILETADRRVLDADDLDVDLAAAGATVDDRGVVSLAADGDEPVWRIVGWGHDVSMVAAEVCDAAATVHATSFDFSSDGQSFSRSQQAAAFRSSAAGFRAQALPRRVRMRRSDDDVAANVQRVAGRRRAFD